MENISQELPEQQSVKKTIPQSTQFPWFRIAIISTAIILVIALSIGVTLAVKENQTHSRLVSYLLPTSTITPSIVSISSTPVSNLTKNWKTYTDNVLHASFKYPQSWTLGGVRKDPSNTQWEEILFQTSPVYESHILVDTNPGNLDYAAYEKEQYPERPDLYTNLSFKDIATAGGVRFRQVITNNDQSSGIFYATTNGKIYILGIESLINKPNSEIIQTISQVASTFTFINQNQETDITSWKTYTNISHKVSFSYPLTFSLQEQDNGPQQFIILVQSQHEEFKLDIQPLSQFSNIMTQAKSTTVFNGVTWGFIPASKYCDGGECSDMYPEYVTAQNGFDYQFILSNQSTTSSFADQILATFRFAK